MICSFKGNIWLLVNCIHHVWYAMVVTDVFPRGAVYKVNKMGPSTLFWGMPCLCRAGSDNSPSIITQCWHSVRYDSSHYNAAPLIPYLCCNLCSKILWLTMLKAADKSSRTRQLTLPSSKFCRISLLTLSSAISVVWCFLYANWIISFRPLLSMWSTSCSATPFSIIF